MIRILFMISSILALAVIAVEGVGLAYLYSRGHLTSATMRDIRDVLSGTEQAELELTVEEDVEQPSNNDVVRDRSMRILELNGREKELALFKNMISKRAESLISEQQKFEQSRKDFEKQLQEMKKAISSEATEQARGILLASSPGDAAGMLMDVELDKAILLVKGMPEKSIAKIIKEFDGDDIKIQQRGRDIFKAISEGEPDRSFIDDTSEQLADDRQAPADTTSTDE